MEGNIAKIYHEYNSVRNRDAQSAPVSFQNREIVKNGAKEIQKDSVEISSKQKEAAKKNRSFIEMLASPFAPLRRLFGVIDETESTDKTRALGLAALAAVNLPMDICDLKSAVHQIKGKAPQIDYKDYQAEFSFAKDTLLDPVLAKIRKKKPDKFDKIYLNLDKSLFRTKFGEKISELLKIGVDDIKYVKEQEEKVFQAIPVYKLSGNKVTKFIGRTMLRIPVISVGILGLLEIPNIINAIRKGKDNKVQAGMTQTAKSAIGLTGSVIGMGTLGAVLERRLGIVGSLIGIGLGGYLGGKAASVANDKIFKKED